jgi:hypothetical protein
LKVEGKGFFIMKVVSILDIEEPEFAFIAKDIIKVAFEVKYKR